MGDRRGEPVIPKLRVVQNPEDSREHERNDDEVASPHRSVLRDENPMSTIQEANKQLRLSGPLIAVSILQYSIQVVSVMFVGHLGELPLSGASIATSFASVTGFSLLVYQHAVPFLVNIAATFIFLLNLGIPCIPRLSYLIMLQLSCSGFLAFVAAVVMYDCL